MMCRHLSKVMLRALTRRYTMVGVMAVLVPLSATAQNSITVESRAVPIHAKDVTVGVYLANDLPIRAIVLPLEIRSVNSNAFMADSLTVEVTGRLQIWEYYGGWVVKNFYDAKSGPRPEFSDCISDSSGSVWSQPTTSVDFVSPDGYMYVGIGISPATIGPGTDGEPGSGQPSLLFRFNIGADTGRFEIDTMCTSLSNHVVYLANDYSPVMPTFTKGVIQIGCGCDCHTDPVCDGVHDVFDFLTIRNVAYYGADPVIDPNPMCPYVDTDVNCDGVTDVFDLTHMSNVVFQGADPATEFCAPCP